MGKKRLAKWYSAANKRRGELIYKDSLTPEEEAELAVLQEKCLAEVNRVHPRPLLLPPGLEELLEKYEAQ